MKNIVKKMFEKGDIYREIFTLKIKIFPKFSNLMAIFCLTGRVSQVTAQNIAFEVGLRVEQ